MKAGVIRSGKVEPFEQGALSIRELADDHAAISIASVKIGGDDGEIVDTVSDTFDYVIEGKGVFVIDGVTHEVAAGDLVFVPKGTSFPHSGSMTMLATHNPPFNPDNLEVVN